MELGAAKNFRDRSVITGGVELTLIISPAHVESEEDSGLAADHRIIHFDGEVEQSVRVIAALAVSLADLGVDQGGVLRRIDLNVSAAQTNQFSHFIAKKIDQVGEKCVYRGIGASGFFGVVVRGSLLCTDERGLRGAIRSRS